MELKERLEKIERENERLVREKNRLEGQIDALKLQMVKEFGTDDVKKLEEKLEAMKADAETMKAEILASVEKMEEQIGINN